MKVYYAIDDFGGGDGSKCRSMQKCVEYFLDELLDRCGFPHTNLTNSDKIDLAPGHCCFFLGGKESLTAGFDERKSVEIRTTDNRSLTVEMRMGLRAKKKLKRLLSSMKAMGLARKDKDDSDRIHNEYSRKELTLVVVYHSDKAQMSNALTEAEGEDKRKVSLIKDSTTLGDVRQLLLDAWLERSFSK